MWACPQASTVGLGGPVVGNSSTSQRFWAGRDVERLDIQTEGYPSGHRDGGQDEHDPAALGAEMAAAHAPGPSSPRAKPGCSGVTRPGVLKLF
jgi:hypothetical protein